LALLGVELVTEEEGGSPKGACELSAARLFGDYGDSGTGAIWKNPPGCRVGAGGGRLTLPPGVVYTFGSHRLCVNGINHFIRECRRGAPEYRAGRTHCSGLTNRPCAKEPRSEADVSAFQHKAEAHPRVSRADAHAWRSQCDQTPPRQGPQTAGSVTRRPQACCAGSQRVSPKRASHRARRLFGRVPGGKKAFFEGICFLHGPA